MKNHLLLVFFRLFLWILAMPDSDTPPPPKAAKRPNEYPIRAAAATPSLAVILRDRIAAEGPMPFSDFMTAALYDSALGYYSGRSMQIGRGGDFFTSVSVGPLFGEILARRFLREWHNLGTPARWRIIECGAHDGALACDVIEAIRKLDASAATALEYAIAEPLPSLQIVQRQRLAHFGDTVRFLPSTDPLSEQPLPGIAFGNELLDALPFHLVEWNGGNWEELRVGNSPQGHFMWVTGEIENPALHSAIAKLEGTFPAGYRTEIRTCFDSILRPLSLALDRGLMIWADYGFPRADYYHPLRRSGTIRTYSRHKACDNPLALPGDVDITAHVEFTAVAESAATLGGHVVDFRDQGSWIIDQSRDWLVAMEGNADPSLMRQFQTLTHPAHLGADFHVLELSWNPASSPKDESRVRRLFSTPDYR